MTNLDETEQELEIAKEEIEILQEKSCQTTKDLKVLKSTCKKERKEKVEKESRRVRGFAHCSKKGNRRQERFACRSTQKVCMFVQELL